MTKDEAADALDEIGTLLGLKGENAFRCNAYHNAARTLRQLPGDLARLVADKHLASVRGIGEAIQAKVTTLVETGELPYLTDLRREIPAGLVEMLKLPGLGEKKIKALHDQLGIDTIEKLKAGCESGAVAALKGFGEKTQQRVLDGIAFLGQLGNRVRIDKALTLADVLFDQLRSLPGVIRAELCGSLRRRRETAKDIDILMSSADPAPIMAAFVKLPEVVQVVAHGPTKSSVVAEMRVDDKKVTMNADLRVVADDQFPFALLLLHRLARTTTSACGSGPSSAAWQPQRLRA